MRRFRKLLFFLLCLSLVFPSLSSIIRASALQEDSYIRLETSTVVELKSRMPLVTKVSDGFKDVPDSGAVGTGFRILTDNKEFKAVVAGDVNGDGSITSIDYLMAKRIFLGSYEPAKENTLAADVNEDGFVTAIDYLLIKRSFLRTYRSVFPNAVSVPILLYHHILPDNDKAKAPWSTNTITISTSEFRSHMQLIKDSGFTVISMDDLVEYVKGAKRIPQKSVVITFDDGYKSNTYYAAPILREFGYCATVFSQTKAYGYEYEPVYNTSSLQHITKTDLEQNSDVFTQQSHTFMNHNYLSQQSYNTVLNDLIKSQNIYKSRYFAYPYGDFNESTIQAVKEAGFEAAFTTVVRNAMVGEDLYKIPRKGITSPMTNEAFLAILNG